MKIKTLKSLALGLLVATSATVGYSQGQVDFFTFNSGIPARGNIFLNGTTTGAGSGFDAQLWASIVGPTSSDFIAISTVVTLSGGIANDSTTAVDSEDTTSQGTNPNPPGNTYGLSDAGNPAWYQVRVWDNHGGTINTWAATGLVWVNGGAGSVNASGITAGITQYGVTAMSGNQTKVTLGGTSTDGNNSLFTVPFANSFNNLTLTATPEPTTLALAGLGGAALLAFRRRKA